MNVAGTWQPTVPSPCLQTAWPSLIVGPFHPDCHWPDLCARNGCFWQAPKRGYQPGAPEQEGLAL